MLRDNGPAATVGFAATIPVPMNPPVRLEMIAISYRREDSLPITGRLYDRLQAKFGRENVFMDFDSIRPGLDFREQIKQTIGRAKVVIAMIGPQWMSIRPDSSRRIDDPDDLVRLEIAHALQSGLPVIPVLINNTPVPAETELPPDIQALAFRHALPLDSGLDFHQHADRLISAINDVIGAGPTAGVRWLAKKPPAKFNPKRTALLAALIGSLLCATGVYFFWHWPDAKRPASSSGVGSAVIGEKSIAVLPFENLSDDKSNVYFAEGIQNEILTRLAKIAELKVISSNSTQQYSSAPRNLREIGQQLGVANILEGSVQKVANAVHVNVQLIRAGNEEHVWAESYSRKLDDVFGVEGEVATSIAEQLNAKLSGDEQKVLVAKPTENVAAYDAYLRGLAYRAKWKAAPDYVFARRYLGEAVRLDPKFALAWALLSQIDAQGYLSTNLEPTIALREEARQAAETALSLQPNLGEALLAKGEYYYGCLRDLETAERYFLQARQMLPNSAPILEALARLERRRGHSDQSIAYFREAERLDPRNVSMLTQWAAYYVALRQFPEALRRLDQILDITPDDLDIVVVKAAIAQAEGDLVRASSILAPLRPSADNPAALETQVYQGILERHPMAMISRLKEVLAKPDPALGYFVGELRFWLGWSQEVAGDEAGALESWRQALNELEPLLLTQPANLALMVDLALIHMGLGNKESALAMAERAMAAYPLQKDALDGTVPIEILARLAARLHEPDRSIATLEKLLSTPGEGALASGTVGRPLTPALLRLDPMFDPLRRDVRFQKLCQESSK